VSAVGPDRSVKLIVLWPAGSDTDNIFRPFSRFAEDDRAAGRHRERRRRVGHQGAKEAKDSPADGHAVRGARHIHSTYYPGSRT
jgi:hypothetical protein